MYVKVGMSDNPFQRVTAIQTGCPLPLVRAAMVKCASREQAKQVEKALHIELSPHSLSGEWFRFDWSNRDQRTFLSVAIESAISVVRDWKLEEINLEAASAFRRVMQMERQKSYRKKRKRQDRLKAEFGL